jgi:hypothetical protein
MNYPPEWSYYFALEDDFVHTSRYVETCEDNFNTYSIQFVRLLLAAGSEVDVIAKEICKKHTPKKLYGIDDFRPVLLSAHPATSNITIGIQWNPLRLKPWDSWSQNINPEWWGAYNDVKHNRTTTLKLANLKNAIHALAGLYVLMLHLDKPQGMARPTQYLRVEST